MAKDLLLEIGLEEMPAHVVTPSMKQLETKITAFLDDNRLSFSSIKAYSTPRRLAVLVSEIVDKQEDIQEEVKGPSKKIALDQEGNWSKAAQGFVRGQGVTTDDITFKELKGEEYVYVTKYIPGKPAEEVLTDLTQVITSLTFPVTMHWNQYDFEYIRPIHWIVALLDEEIIPLQILDVKSGRASRGHRFLGNDLTFATAKEYEEKLATEFVIADPMKRQEMITEQIAEIAAKENFVVNLDVDLLEEVNNLVEYPTAFVGNFADKYLAVPEEVLVTSMKEHQRYFDVRNQEGLLLPHFISVRNGNNVKLENVAKGNEKVLTARLEDAEFFYNEDKKLTIDELVEKLKNVTFHEKIGSMYEKMQRVGVSAQIIGETVGLTNEELEDLKRASEIYKFDLVTNMVGEFPELQGIMGEKYTLLQGEKPAVAQAIREHYLPISSEGELPESNIGAVLAIADKMDSLQTFFAAGMLPSGSNDPYALRRQTYGIVRIIEAKSWYFPLIKLQQAIGKKINSDEARFGIQLASGQKEVADFFKARLRQRLHSEDTRHDVIDAVVNSEQEDVTKLFKAANILNRHLQDDNFKTSVEALTRAINLAKKNEANSGHVDPNLFENESEQALFDAVADLEQKFPRQTMEENYQGLMDLRPVIEAYFDATMVMVDDERIRRNRLNQLQIIAKMALAFASLDELLTK
ncbi:glycine-tRNA ligase, beta subunit [Enterococcus asini ATCC 700915]|uniref:Glycine--tRNA ligase beta subunit n=1 Tax=Enterococcus asini ATCC 700915 TaxID=1158606 RepID=R2SFG1_9ENTE|nr:glycine--tRNA ligase subunit beta [Enterococcus asini]EOH86904.1 glycine-tRNA ligase, beta subunit [Enterococcus asini ATCC 700915]EOT58173.1 glycine-tRNA ligase, beta subunit [Enterococcus asini ATCC 700915]OJG13190.1 glycine-tRNA ligase, beta subunit [Enterococcus asini]